MKLSQVVFIESVRDTLTDRNVSCFVATESPTRADGYGYELEARDAGVFAKHPKRPGVERFIPWSNVKWCDTMGALRAVVDGSDSGIGHDFSEETVAAQTTELTAAQLLKGAKPDKRTKAYRESLAAKPEV
jgi:hypothetical protein